MTLPTLPPAMLRLLAPFAPLFSRRVWPHALILVAGTLLAPGQRTVTAALRVMGLARGARFERYHRVLNRATWSGLAVGRVLLALLVAVFVPAGPLVIGVDDTLERRRGKKIAPKGISRDAVRSGHAHFVKASGLRWVCLTLLVPIPWARRVWALPFLAALAPSERYDREHGRRHKTLTDWARQSLLGVRRWWPDRPLVAVADSSYAALEFLAECRSWPNPVAVVTRLRLDAALYEPAPPRRLHRSGRPRPKGKRPPPLATVAVDPATVWTETAVADWYGAGQRTVAIVSDTAVWYHSGLPPVPLRWVPIRDPRGQFDPQALLSTDQDAAPAQILAWFVRRWQLEVAFGEARRRLGVETQRQRSEVAIRRTTPAVWGLFSLVTLAAHRHMTGPRDRVRHAAWYPKDTATFADALALVRHELWAHQAFCGSTDEPDMVKLPRRIVDRFTDTLCYAA